MQSQVSPVFIYHFTLRQLQSSKTDTSLQVDAVLLCSCLALFLVSFSSTEGHNVCFAHAVTKNPENEQTKLVV